jgi:hypothetical protein
MTQTVLRTDRELDIDGDIISAPAKQDIDQAIDQRGNADT